MRCSVKTTTTQCICSCINTWQPHHSLHLPTARRRHAASALPQPAARTPHPHSCCIHNAPSLSMPPNLRCSSSPPASTSTCCILLTFLLAGHAAPALQQRAPCGPQGSQRDAVQLWQRGAGRALQGVWLWGGITSFPCTKDAWKFQGGVGCNGSLNCSSVGIRIARCCMDCVGASLKSWLCPTNHWRPGLLLHMEWAPPSRPLRDTNVACYNGLCVLCAVAA